jgi:uncharacterized protein YdaU (DUF1376 family)
MKKPAEPAIPFFGDAYLADTRHLTLEEHGAYLQLLMIAWRTVGCCLPDNDRRIAQMLSVSPARWGRLKPVIMDFWQLEDGVWRQRRLTKERRFVDEKRAKNREAADQRWHGQVSENAQDGEYKRISERNCERSAPPPPPPHDKNISLALTTLRARDCFNEVCAAADWHPSSDSQREYALGVIDDWLGLGFDLERDILAGIRKARESRPERTRSLTRFTRTIECIHRDRTDRNDRGPDVRQIRRAPW